jgi:hypothetical protein
MPSQLPWLERSPWPPRIFPILVGALLVWAGFFILGTWQNLVTVGVYLVPTLALVELMAIWAFWGNPQRGQAGDLVVTSRGLARRFPHRLVFIPWVLTGRPRRDPLAGDLIPYRLSKNSGLTTGRLLLTREQTRAVWASPHHPVGWGPDSRISDGRFQPGPAGPLPIEHSVAWPAAANSDDRVVRLAREPAATAVLTQALGTMILAASAIAFMIGYIEGSLLAVVEWAVPFALTVYVGRRLARKVSRPKWAVGLVAVLAIAPVLAWSAVIYFGGVGLTLPPYGYVLLPALSAALGLEVGYAMALGTLRPDVLDALNSSAPSPSRIDAV